VTGRELESLLEYDALEPPVSRQDLMALFGMVLVKLHNANFKNPIGLYDVFPSLRPDDWVDPAENARKFEEIRRKALCLHRNSKSRKP